MDNVIDDTIVYLMNTKITGTNVDEYMKVLMEDFYYAPYNVVHGVKDGLPTTRYTFDNEQAIKRVQMTIETQVKDDRVLFYFSITPIGMNDIIFYKSWDSTSATTTMMDEAIDFFHKWTKKIVEIINEDAKVLSINAAIMNKIYDDFIVWYNDPELGSNIKEALYESLIFAATPSNMIKQYLRSEIIHSWKFKFRDCPEFVQKLNGIS